MGPRRYMYRVAKDYLPDEALYMIRYHSFYPGHSTPAYDHLKNDHDFRMFEWVRNSTLRPLHQTDAPPDAAALRPYYEDLIARYFPRRNRLVRPRHCPCASRRSECRSMARFSALRALTGASAVASQLLAMEGRMPSLQRHVLPSEGALPSEGPGLRYGVRKAMRRGPDVQHTRGAVCGRGHPHRVPHV